MKNIKKIASIVLALALVISVFVPTFVIGATDTLEETPADTTVENENYIVDDNDTHNCTISKANATRHIVDCECGNYERIRHSELEKVAVNEFFHIQSCVCGYVDTTEHEFDTAFNRNCHYAVCVDCGYSAPAEEHTLCDVFDGNKHYIECDSCGYMAERHIGVDYASVGQEGCYAFCPDCNVFELVAHEWDGFQCQNCDYKMSGKTAGIIERIWYSDEDYTVRIDVNGTNHIIDLYELNFEEDDCVVVEHYGNDIWDVRVIEYDLCDNPENIPVYVDESVLAEMAYENYDSNTISDIEVYDDGTAIIEFYNNLILWVENAVVYDFVNGEVVDIDWLCEGERIIWFYADDQLVILDYYY